MLPHSQEFPPEGTKEMATTPEALNLVKSDKSNREESAVEGSRDPSPTTRESAERGAAQGTQEDSRISDYGDAKRPEAEEAERAATASSRGSSRHSARLASGEPMEGAVLHTQPSEEKTANDSVGCTQSSAVLGAVVNTPKAADTSDNGTFSDEEYIDVVSLDPAEEQSHSSVDESRIQTERDRLVVENSRSFGEICTFGSAPQVPRKSNEGGGDRAATDDDRVPSLDSGCYSDDEMRMRARRASAEWSDVAGEKKAAAHQNLKPVYLPDKEAFSEKGTVHQMSPPQPELISSGTDSRQVTALQPVKPIYAPDKEAFSQKGLHRTSPPSTNLKTPDNDSQQMVGYTSEKYDYPCLQSYGKHTLYNPPEARLPQIGSNRGTVYDGMSPGRNSTEVVYTFDTSSVRMSTGTSLVGPPHEQRVNSTVDPGTSRSNGTLAPIVLDKSKTDKYDFNTDRLAMNSETLMGVRSTVSATSVKQISSQSPDRAEIISIPSKKSAFVTAAHTTAQDVALMSVNGPEISTMLHTNVRQGLNFSRAIPYSLEGLPFKPLASGYYPGRILIPNNSLNQQLFREESALGHVTDRKAVVPASAFHMDNSDTAWSVMNPFEQKMVTPETPRKGSKRRSRKIVDVAANTNVNEEPLEKVPRLSYPNILHPPVSEQPYFPVLRSAISSTGLQNVPATTTQRPMAYRSEILKSYLKGEQVINDATGVPFKALRPTEAPATNTSHNVMIRDQVKVSAVNDTNSRDRLHGSEQPKRVNENREQQPIHKIEKRAFDVGRLLNLEENGSLDLRKKHPALSMGGPQSEAVARLAQMRDQCLPPSTDFRLAMKSVPKNGSVIVPTSGDQGERVNSGVDPSTARSVIVSSVSRKLSSAEVRLVDAAAVGTAPLPTPTALDASTVLAYEPSGRESRYVVTRQGSGNSFVIREVGSLSEPPAAKREVARRGRGEADTAGVLVAQGSGHSRAPMQQEARGARGGGMSVIRTAPAEDDDDVQVLEVYRRPGSFEPTGSERPWADAEFSAASAGGLPGDEAYAGGGAAAADRALRLRLWVVLWALLGGERLRAVGWPRAPVRRVLWRAVDVCCSAAGAKSAAAVPLPADHDCGADMACFRDHAHRLLEVCAPTRDHWKRYGWASLTVDAVVAKVYREDILPWLRSLRPEVIPEAVRDSLRLLQCMETARERGPPPPAPLVLRPAPAPEAAPSLSPAPTSSQPPAAASTSSASGVQEGTRKKRGRPAKQASSADAGRVERVMLWRFLLNLLEDARNEPCIHWVHRDQGIFRILNTDWLARLWGRRHGNPRMTYEKMARAMRTYYRSKVLQPVPRSPNLPRKLVYKFNPSVVQRVAAANKLAQQQQQQLQQQHQSQRNRQSRFAIPPQANLADVETFGSPTGYKERQLSDSQQMSVGRQEIRPHMQHSPSEPTQHQTLTQEQRLHSVDQHHIVRGDRQHSPSEPTQHQTLTQEQRLHSVDQHQIVRRDRQHSPSEPTQHQTLTQEQRLHSVDQHHIVRRDRQHSPNEPTQHQTLTQEQRLHSVDQHHVVSRDRQHSPNEPTHHKTLTQEQRLHSVDQHHFVRGDRQHSPSEATQHQTRTQEQRLHSVDQHHIVREDRQTYEEESVDNGRLGQYVYPKDIHQHIDKGAESNKHILSHRLKYQHSPHWPTERVPPLHSPDDPHKYQEKHHQTHSPHYNPQQHLKQHHRERNHHDADLQHDSYKTYHQHQQERVTRHPDPTIRELHSPDGRHREELRLITQYQQHPHRHLIYRQNLNYRHSLDHQSKIQQEDDPTNRLYLNPPKDQLFDKQEQVKQPQHQSQHRPTLRQQVIYQRHDAQSVTRTYHHDNTRLYIASPKEQCSEPCQQERRDQKTQQHSEKEAYDDIDDYYLSSPKDNGKYLVKLNQDHSRNVPYSQKERFIRDHPEKLFLHSDPNRYSPNQHQREQHLHLKHVYKLPARHGEDVQTVTHIHDHYQKYERPLKIHDADQLHHFSEKGRQRQSQHQSELQYRPKETDMAIDLHIEHKEPLQQVNDVENQSESQSTNDKSVYSPKELQQLRAYRIEHKLKTHRELQFKRVIDSANAYPKQQDEAREHHHHNHSDHHHDFHQQERQESQQRKSVVQKHEHNESRQEDCERPETQAGASDDRDELMRTPDGGSGGD